MAEQETGQRQRVAAIVAADVVGYSRLMADDETATIAALDAARAVFTDHITANQGRVVDTAGDSVLAIFETTAGAVEAAMAVQAALAESGADVPEPRRMRFRIGVHLGDIHEKADGTIYGDGVNIAARLEGLAAPGSVAVSDAVQATIRGRVSFGFADLGEHKVKNIQHPVRAFRVLAEGEAAPVTRKWPDHWRPAALAVVLVLAVIAVNALWPASEPPIEISTAEPEVPIPSLATGPAIAVLPFDESAGEDDWFADGIAEDILTRLSRFTNLKVIARNSSFQYKGQAVDVRDVGGDLGADYVLEGSVRRTAETIRVTVQLLDARDGAHVWAETYDRALTTENLFALQDDITARIASAVGGNFGAIAAARISELRTRPPETLESYECVLLAYRFQRVVDAPTHLAARTCLEEAVEREPDYVDGLAWLGHIYVEEFWSNLNPRSDGLPSLEAAFSVLNRAVALDANHQKVRHALAYAFYMKRDIEAFRLQAERAISLNPNNIETMAEMAWMTAYSGEWDRGLEMFNQLEQMGATIPAWLYGVPFFYHYRLGEYSRALDYGRNFLELSLWAYRIRLVMVHAQLGNADEARAALAETRRREPDLSAALVRQTFGRLIADSSVVEKLMEGYEKALAFEADAGSQRPVIAVLPFDNLSGDAEQDYFVDGLTEDIIAALSRFQHLAVIARNSAFRYKGQTIDVRAIGNELGARYVVEGSIRRGGNTIRIIARLIDVESETQIWSETFERALTPENIFAIQDEVTARIASTIGDTQGVIGIASMDEMRRASPTSLASYDCVLRATEYKRSLSDAHLETARECLEATVRSDPDYALAWAWLCEIYLDEYRRGIDPEPDLVDKALAAGTKAIQMAPNDGRAYFAQANAYYYSDNFDAFAGAAERALQLNPYSADIHIQLGHRYAYAGHWEKGLALVDKAIEMQPFYAGRGNFVAYFHHYQRGEYETALEHAITMNLPDYIWALGALAAAYGQLGRTDDAASAVARMLELRPDIAQTARTDRAKFFRYLPDLLDHFMDGLRKAGLDIPEAPSD